MKKILLTAFAAIACSSIASAGTVIEYRDANSGSTHTTMKVNEGRVLVNDDAQPDQMLYTSTGNRMFIINHRKRSYSVMDEKAMERMAGMVDDAMAQMEEQLANVPPAQREQMREMMGGMMDMGKKMMEPKIERTGRSGEFNGLSCDFVTITVPNVTKSELCVSSIDALDISGSDRQALQKMQDHMQKVSEMMSETLGMNIPFNQVGGIPVFIRDEDTPAGRVLHLVGDADISPEELDIPDGYREVPLERMGE